VGYTTVNVPSIGEIRFPSTMSEEEIKAAIEQQLRPQPPPFVGPKQQPPSPLDSTGGTVPWPQPPQALPERNKTPFDYFSDVYLTPGEGANQAASGVKNLVTGEGGRRSAASDVLEGTGKAMVPFLPLALAAGGVAGAPALAKGVAAGGAGLWGAGKMADLLGWEPETKRLAQNIGAFAPAGTGVVKALSANRMANQIAAKQAEAVVAAQAAKTPAARSAAQAQIAALETAMPKPKVVAPSGITAMLKQEQQLGPVAATVPDRLIGITPREKEIRKAVGDTYSSILPGKITSPERGAISVPIEDVKALSAWAQGKVSGGKEVKNKALEQWVDRFDPLRQLVKSKSLSPAQDPYVAARLYAGHAGKIDNRLHDLREILRPAAKEKLLKDATEYALYERYQELAGRGITKFPDGVTIEQIAAKRAALEQKLGTEKLARVREIDQQLRGYSARRLKEVHDGGLISDESYAAIVANNEKYIPLQRLAYMEEQLAKGRIETGGNAFNLSKQDIVHAIKGSEKEILDPIQGMIRNTYKTVAQVERNKVATKVADLAGNPEFEGLVVRLKKGEMAPSGMDTFHILRKGIKEDYAAPAEVVESMKGMNQVAADYATKFASISSKALRTGATSMNMAFFIPNMIRDAQTAKLVSKTGFGIRDWMGGFAEAIRRGDDFREFMETGASFAGFFERQTSLPRTVEHLTRSKGSEIARKVINPVEMMRILGETTEMAPRLGVFKRSRRVGMTGEEAAFNSRNATIDFAKMGSKMRTFNMLVPFLNARLQGTVNSFAALKRNPVKGGAVLGYTVALPTMYAYIHNTTFFPEVWDDIKQYEKDSNFIIIYGNKKDSNGKYYQVIKIPKGDVGRIFGNPIENFLEWQRTNKSKSFRELAMETASDISPIDFSREGKFDIGKVISGSTPPLARAGAEVASNRNFYFDSPIVPMSLESGSAKEEYTKDTAPWIRGTAEKLSAVTKPVVGNDVSPLKLQHLIQAQFGGLGRQATQVKGTSPLSVAADMATVPFRAVGQRFKGVRAGGEAEDWQSEIRASEEGAADETIRAKRNAQSVFAKVKEAPQEDKMPILDSLDEDTRKRVFELAEMEARGFDELDRSLYYSRIKTRAEIIMRYLKSRPVEEREQRFIDWKQKKIITPKVIEEMNRIASQ